LTNASSLKIAAAYWACMYVYMCEWSTVFSLPLCIQKYKSAWSCMNQPTVKFGKAKTPYPVPLFA
jgi:hypothetical protein